MARQGFWWYFNYRANPPVHPSIGGAPILDGQSPAGSTMVRMVGRLTVDLIISGVDSQVAWTFFAGVCLADSRQDPHLGDSAQFDTTTWPWWDMITPTALSPLSERQGLPGYLGRASIPFDVEGARTFTSPQNLQFCFSTPYGQPPSPGGCFVRFSVRTFVLWP